MRDDFERVICDPSSRGIYESNYLKANNPGGPGGFWIKYNLLSPSDPSYPRVGEIWVVFWREPGQRPIVFKQNVDESEIRANSSRIEIDMASASLRPDRSQGTVESDGHKITWDLKLTEGGLPLFHYPYHKLYEISFPKKKILTPKPRQIFAGTIEVDDEVFTIDRWVGIRGHNWGSEHAHSYAYGNANLWDQPGDWIFDGFSARILLGRTLSPWLSSAILRLPKSEVRFSKPWKWINSSALVDFPSWSCTFETGGTTVNSHWTLDPEDVAGLRYLHPDGRLSYCYNTKFARLRVTMERHGNKDQRTTTQAELEFLTPTPIPGIPLHGNDLLIK